MLATFSVFPSTFTGVIQGHLLLYFTIVFIQCFTSKGRDLIIIKNVFTKKSTLKLLVSRIQTWSEYCEIYKVAAPST